MKKIFYIVALTFSFGVYAQDVAPKFEKEGNKVKATYFHTNGEIAQQGYFLNEKLEGEWTMFNEKGDKIAMGNYFKGAKTGTWMFWEGDTVKEVDFNDNRIAAVTESKRRKSIVKN
ncbi:nicotinic acid mononucleotide adenyltransferase [Maribacter chungangensis]|uniref:Nicotinic acid mononucleotide adenyltransferase n=1 Tax=Maribacter chungangensis TaxID=1069117 RepID=A0ABW3AZU3_9FLAO